MIQQIKVIMVVGPTATGKSDLAVKLAQKFPGEIINADSRQVYKLMDIGTNKGKIKQTNFQIEIDRYKLSAYELENTGVLGWLFNVVKPDQEFNLAHFQKLAYGIIADIFKRGKLPIITGGTGLYIDSLIKKYQLKDVAPDWELRKKLADFSGAELYNKLKELNPQVAKLLNESDRKNPYRLIRKIEIALFSKKSIQFSFPKDQIKINSVMLYPKFKKTELFQRIAKRVDLMFEQGLIAEVKKLIGLGYPDSKPMTGMGYKEVQAFLQRKIRLDVCKNKIIQAHKKYADRQITWFEGKGRGYNLLKYDFKKDIKKINSEVKKF